MVREMNSYLEELQERKSISQVTEEDRERQRARKRLTAREWIDLLFDPDTFTEIDTLVTPRYDVYLGGKESRYGDGVVQSLSVSAGQVVAQNDVLAEIIAR